MDGRDIGTTVFPDAEMKVFVDASAETRAHRRFLELQQKGMEATYEDVLANVKQRDHIDTTRAESPLTKASDAISLDNSDMTIAEQNEWLIELYNRILAARTMRVGIDQASGFCNGVVTAIRKGRAGTRLVQQALLSWRHCAQ